MPIRRKVRAVGADAVGVVHPLDGPLGREGSEWTMDTFTQRMLLDGSIAFHERPAIVSQPPSITAAEAIARKPVADVTTARPKVLKR